MKKGQKMSTESRLKLSNSCKGRIPWNKGKTGIYSDETIRKMSSSRKGQLCGDDNPAKREDVREKISKSLRGRIVDKEWKKHMSDGRKRWIKEKPEEAQKQLSHAGKTGWTEERRKITSKKFSKANKGKPKSQEMILKISGINHHNWKGGYYPYYGKDWCRYKTIVRRRRSVSELSGKKENLQVHHIYPLREFVKRYIELCLKPYIPEIKNIKTLRVIPYEVIPECIFEEANNDDNLLVLTSSEHKKIEKMNSSACYFIKENNLFK